MPFDFMPAPILNPSVRNLPPRERLARLRDWLYEGGPGGEAWDYSIVENDCGTIGCAILWYTTLTGAKQATYYEGGANEFDITERQSWSIFFGAASVLNLHYDLDTTPQDVAAVIDKVLEGKIS